MAEPEHDELAAELRALRAQVAGLQADVRRLEAGRFANADHGWAVEGENGEPSLSWISTLEAPVPRRLAVPRLVLELGEDGQHRDHGEEGDLEHQPRHRETPRHGRLERGDPAQ